MLNYYFFRLCLWNFMKAFIGKYSVESVTGIYWEGEAIRVGSDKTQTRTKPAHGHPYMNTTALMCTKLSLLSDFYCIFKH